MKKIKLLFVFIIGMMVLQSYGQTISNIINVDTTLKKSDLYSNALSFFALQFKSANNVIQMKDSETGKVIGKGIVDEREITIEIVCKDSKYKYDINIEPCKNDINIIFNTSNFGYWKNCKSIGKIKWNNGKVNIPLSEIYLINSTTFGNISYYGPYPLGMKSGYEKWKSDIDNEISILYDKYLKISNPNEENNKLIIDNIIDNLKKEMSKKSNW